MDFVTSIASTMQLQSALYARFEVSAPWAVRFAPGADRARFGVVTHGSCWLSRMEGAPILLRAGDLFLLRDPRAFVLGDGQRSPPRTCASLMQEADAGSHVIRFGGDGAEAKFITGWFGLDPTANRPMIELLPELLHFRVDDEHKPALQAALELLALETSKNAIGGGLVVRGLADILFVQAIRAYFAAAPDPKHGLLAALSDARLGRAIRAMHTAPANHWTVESLAAKAGMSRSAFAATFRAVLKRTPLDYLTDWRIRLARRLLLETDHSLAAIAHRVGYATDAAFAKAFRRVAGSTPAAFRRAARSAPQL